MYNLSTEIIHQTSQSDVNRGGGGHTEIVKCRDDQTLRVWASEKKTNLKTKNGSIFSELKVTCARTCKGPVHYLI